MEEKENNKSEEQESPFSGINLDAFGVDSVSAMKIVALIPKFVSDFSRGVPQMAIEERAIQEALRRLVDEKHKLLIQSISSIRSFLLTLTGFSLTAIGIGISVLTSKGELVGSEFLFYGGLLAFGLNVVGSVVYILYIHTKENNSLTELLDFDRAFAADIQKIIKEHYLDQSKSFDMYKLAKDDLIARKKVEEDKLKPKRRRDWIPHMLGTLFLLGLLALSLSFFLWRDNIECFSQSGAEVLKCFVT